MEDVVEQTRRDISLQVSQPGESQTSAASFVVSFQSPEARTAMRVTERFASLFVQENIEDRVLAADQTFQFLQLQAEQLRPILIQSQETLAAWNQRSGGRPIRADLAVDHEVLLKRYRDLLVKVGESDTAVNLERHQIGEQFRIIDAARMPERPIGPVRLSYQLWGAVAGLMSSLLLMLLSSMWRRRR